MLFLLTRKNDIGYDEYESKVVCAHDEQEARKMANGRVGYEGKIWEDKRIVRCEIIDPNVNRGVVLESFNAG